LGRRKLIPGGFWLWRLINRGGLIPRLTTN
jgi:hypothetical protein